MPKLRLFEIFLLQAITYTVVWLIDMYVGSYLTLILPAVAAVILFLTWIIEFIEPARVGKRYYLIMGITIVTPLLVGAFFYCIYGGDIAWMQD